MQSQAQLNTSKQPISELRKRIQGTVITPGDSGYEEARLAWNLVVDQHPAVIVIPTRPYDVAEAVRVAKAASMGVAIQTSGHGVIIPANDCMLILTSQLSGVEINTEDQTAWVGGGSKWMPVLEKAQECGLAPLLGSTPDIGAVGYTLGGGLGWLARKYGTAADSTRAFQVVTADGQIVQAGPDENADLFWALRGGGKGMGVVTAMQIQLYPLSTIYAGNLYYPPELAGEVFARFREWTAYAPDELTSSVVLINYPPIPALPDFLRGQSFVLVRGCYCGPTQAGEDLLRFWRDWQAPVLDDFKAIPFMDIAKVSNDPVDPLPARTSTLWLNNLNDQTSAALIQYGLPQAGPPAYVFIEVRHTGGAVARQNAQSGAFGNRQSPYLLECVGMTPNAQAIERFDQHTRQMKAAIQDAASHFVYLNFLEGEEAWQSTQNGFLPETYQKLQAIKARYDPDNLFRFSFNIPPTVDPQPDR